jgi:N-methylhydantoinase A
VSDANLVLGRLSPAGLLGGGMALDIAAARAALTPAARRLEMSVEQTAHGLLGIVAANMVRAIRAISVERGHDPRDFVLLPFGGAGPLHAGSVARSLGISRLLVPPAPGILCARGLVVSDLRESFVLSRLMPLSEGALPDIQASLDELKQQAEAWFELSAIAPCARQLHYSLDMRYVGQNYELQVDLDGDLSRLAENFFAVHERSYGYHNPADPVEVVNLRITAIGRLAGAEETETLLSHAPGPPDHHRPVWFDGEAAMDTPIYDRAQLAAGQELTGPVVIEQLDATTLLAPGDQARIDDFGNLHVELSHAP